MELINLSSATESVIASKCVRVCQSKSCRKLGAATVLAAFQSHPIADVEVVECGCLGQCGNGPMVVVSPEQVWYCGVRSEEVAAIVTRHLQNGKPIKAMLYPKFHP
ncbi:2Fe-2S ferredoxin [Phormidesmis priestleyi ULC007]|uniref:2Fe-2S ferredoxin n=1 Tax=Phormidesmis priestleyi ULC007 TaxID=1920490 RepID=A0A2T1DEP8_9CYAN|nr:(2Fe-2S) ferredoxin domain-containing protein [Phormidesmis priestleyi]PSB18933.1 2Fe-2S ferredoxin [Phormidesmis priestleyi ULC007]PZO53921.1 MAG: (2Fe-2S) ferredoxin domain-containing protein [Phormidesmis priestleyi]